MLGEELQRAGGSSPIVQRLINHPSNYAREWLAFAIAAQEGLPLAERLRRIRPIAADPNTNVREAAWLALRPHLADDIRRTITLLAGWPHDADARIRRFAIEGTRPRGVWSAHIPQLKTEPELALSLLEPVRADPSDLVRRATANWLNDASKSRPDWVAGVCSRWLSESPTDETAWICNHALRTLRNDRRRPRNANTTATASALASGRSGA